MERDYSAVTRENSPLQQVPGDPDAYSSDPEVHSITDAAAAHSEDMRERMIKYSIAMGIRMVCIVLIFVVDGWFKILAVAGAVFLPWIAVVIANGSDKAEVHSDSLLDYVAVPEIEGTNQSGSDEEPEADDSVTLLQGELVDDETPAGDDASKEAGNAGDERAAS
ncbi:MULTISPECIES: DUF3099 domain-containing protein [Paenarthrobacter]|uniref:DUF3099 domain-containing protein n=1 Tax=Paenarthrobacter TaxID=1742992 RepID=UPI0014086385|nr:MULTISPECIES: DUF3099 domain-containing protein [Paenarthrobacter]MCX8453916.1 DUF3099 domain-containing protein [Paenarthrobacter ureafaciens]MCY0971913.1 DUF3099 domain-containing protein [Paenarthrobacter ureafaciens]QOT17122.1 DUF3099 domain-containing protein [Paenarthrobacter sp. YJN-5]QQQ60791.1 DUF3099 domain-containing protein [Paenarthrobacter ureafaciens]UOD79500.1 DUF3099 domain-containing protein [Paenarthrobacter ureafaciens]